MRNANHNKNPQTDPRTTTAPQVHKGGGAKHRGREGRTHDPGGGGGEPKALGRTHDPRGGGPASDP